MKQEDIQLLFEDLSARLPYGVKCFHPYGIGELDSIDVEDYGIDVTFKTPDDNYYSIEECKPYLRPISSMTEEERIELDSIPFSRLYKIVEDDLPWSIANYRQLDWLNAHHFDYQGLIKKGLALEAPKDMYK